MRSAIGGGKIVVLADFQTALALYLGDIQAGNFQTVVFQDIFLDFRVGCLGLGGGNIQLVQLQVDLYDIIRRFSGQRDNTLHVAALSKKFKVQFSGLLSAVISLENKPLFKSSMSFAVSAFRGSRSGGGKRVAFPPHKYL